MWWMHIGTEACDIDEASVRLSDSPARHETRLICHAIQSQHVHIHKHKRCHLSSPLSVSQQARVTRSVIVQAAASESNECEWVKHHHSCNWYYLLHTTCKSKSKSKSKSDIKLLLCLLMLSLSFYGSLLHSAPAFPFCDFSFQNGCHTSSRWRCLRLLRHQY